MIEYVDSSSANRLSCRTTSRNPAPTTVMAATMAAGWPHAAASHLRAGDMSGPAGQAANRNAPA